MSGPDRRWRPRPRIWHKLVVICAAFTVPLGLTTSFLVDEQRIKIDFAEAELAGDRYLRPLAQLLSDVSHHRTLTRERLSGAGDDRPANLVGRIDAAFAALARVDAELSGQLQTTPAQLEARRRGDAIPARLQAQWDVIKTFDDPDELAASEAAHARLVAGVRTLIAHVGDTSKLILDPDLDTYYVMDALLLREPDIIERLHRLGDDVAAVLGGAEGGTRPAGGSSATSASSKTSSPA